EQLVDSAELTIGGSASITACAAARVGARTSLVATLGDDLYGKYMLGELAERGVDTERVSQQNSANTGLTVVLSEGDDRAILTFPGAIERLRASDLLLPAEDVPSRLHLSGFYLQPGLRDGLVE